MSEPSSPLSSLANIRVMDVMNRDVLTCSADDSLRQVAAIMAKHRVHSVVIAEGDTRRPEGVVFDEDVIDAIAAGVERTAGQVGHAEPLSVSARERVRTAAQIMSQHRVSHLVVLDAAGGYPVGVLSSLDIAVVYGQL